MVVAWLVMHYFHSSREPIAASMLPLATLEPFSSHSRPRPPFIRRMHQVKVVTGSDVSASAATRSAVRYGSRYQGLVGLRGRKQKLVVVELDNWIHIQRHRIR